MAEIKFDEGLKRLEKIVDELEAGDIPLEDALGKYEEGIRLSKLCAKKLEEARKKIEILLKSGDGSVELAPFDEKDATTRPAPKKKTKKPDEGEALF